MKSRYTCSYEPNVERISTHFHEGLSYSRYCPSLNVSMEIPMATSLRKAVPRDSEPPGHVLLHSFPEPEVEAKWRAMLCRVPMPSHYTAPEYFLEPYFQGKRPFGILALEGHAVTGVLTGFHNEEGTVAGLSTRPQIQIDPEASREKTSMALARGLIAEAGSEALVNVYSWEELDCLPRSFRRRAFPGIPMLDLSRSSEALFSGLDKKRRNNIRYAMKHGVEVSPATCEADYRAFHEIYLGWCQAKATPAYSWEIEHEAFTRTLGNRILFLARHEGRIIAGSVFRFYPGGLVEYSRNSSLPEVQNLKPNDLLVWRAVEWAQSKGFPLLSMGASHKFLREFGGEERPVYRHRYDRTFLRRYDRKEQFVDFARELAARLPERWETRLRKFTGKEVKAGW